MINWNTIAITMIISLTVVAVVTQICDAIRTKATYESLIKNTDLIEKTLKKVFKNVEIKVDNLEE